MIAYQISNLSHNPFRFFDNKPFISKQYLEVQFFCESFYSFACVKTFFLSIWTSIEQKLELKPSYIQILTLWIHMSWGFKSLLSPNNIREEEALYVVQFICGLSLASYWGRDRTELNMTSVVILQSLYKLWHRYENTEYYTNKCSHKKIQDLILFSMISVQFFLWGTRKLP